MWSVLCVCLSVCEQDYWRTNEPVSLKLGVMIGPTSRKNLLTFGDTDSGSPFHFSDRCEMRDFRRFISISHTVTGRFLRYLVFVLHYSPYLLSPYQNFP